MHNVTLSRRNSFYMYVTFLLSQPVADIHPLAFKYPAWLKSGPASLLVCHIPFPLVLVLTTSQATKFSSKRLVDLKDIGTKAECML